MSRIFETEPVNMTFVPAGGLLPSCPSDDGLSEAELDALHYDEDE